MTAQLAAAIANGSLRTGGRAMPAVALHLIRPRSLTAVVPPLLTPDAVNALMVRYQAGDAEAFDRLYALLAPSLRRFLSSLCRDATWTEDLLQEAFLQIHRARHTFNSAYPLQPWVIAIARHVFLMERRRRSRKRDLDSVTDHDVDRLTVASHDEALLARDEVRRGLAELSPGARRAVVLHHVQGWSFKEVGAKLGIRATAAKVRASRGMAALRGKLDETERGNGD